MGSVIYSISLHSIFYTGNPKYGEFLKTEIERGDSPKTIKYFKRKSNSLSWPVTGFYWSRLLCDSSLVLATHTFYGSGILNKKPAQLSLSTLTPGVTELQVVYFYKNLELSTDGIDVSYVETGSTVWWKYWIWALLDSVDVFIVT